MQKNRTAKRLAVSGLIAACYIALGTVFAPLAFGQVQVRFAEVLTLLPIFSPAAVWGVTVGCLLTNVYGLTIGANIIGIYDIFFGTAATLVAAILTRKFRGVTFKGVHYLAAVPPVLVNALVVGGELTYVMSPGGWNSGIFAVNFAFIALGQAIACFGIGLPLMRYLAKSGLAEKIFND